jgi:hypothetical protein
MAPKRAPTFSAARGAYSRVMNDGIFFADAELPFHVWVRESTNNGYRWVLREAPGGRDALAAAGDASGARSASPERG